MKAEHPRRAHPPARSEDMSIRQWHAYPNTLPRELYSDEKRSGEKFDTL